MDIMPDLKEKAEELVKKLQGDKSLLEGFQQDPVKTLEKLLGRDLPDEKLRALAAGIKDKLGRPGSPQVSDAPSQAAPPVGRLADAARRAAMKKHK